MGGITRVAGVAITLAFVTSIAWADGPTAIPRTELVEACGKLHRPSLCFPANTDAPTGNACFVQCVKWVDNDGESVAKSAQDECEAKYIEADGKGHFACGLSPATARREDQKKLKASFNEAIRTLNLQALDAVFTRVLTLDTLNRDRDCTAACNERGRSRVRAPKEAPALVRAFKVCMLRTDSTPEARKFEAYDHDLYAELMTKTTERCRAASKCDWLEEFSDLECTTGGASDRYARGGAPPVSRSR